MGLTIRSNISSMRAQRSLATANDMLNASSTRLASGFRINSAADDAAGLAIASQLSTSSRIYTQGIRNLNDGMSVLNVAEGALSQLAHITIRQKELAEQAANGVYSSKQREALDKEANALVDEYNRIIASTKVNGVSLLNGDLISGMRIQAGFGVNESISVSVGSNLSGVLGDGTFEAQQTISLTGAARMMNGDLNGDGKEDLVVLSSNQPRVLIGNGDGTFRAPVSYAGGTTNSSVFLADLDGDNSLDMLISDVNTLYVLTGNGDGTFNARRTYAAPANALGIQAGDVNEDGRVDVLVSDTSSGGSSIYLMMGNGDGSFKAHITFAMAGMSGSSVLADLNGDANLDFYALDSENERMYVFLGNGDGSFKARRTYSGAGAASPQCVF